MKDFVLTYWKQILDIFSILFCITFFVIKKRPVKVVNSVLDFLYKTIPHFITLYEVPGHGIEKREKVVDAVILALKDYFPGIDADAWRSCICNIIEEFLSTPQKKGE